MKEETFGYIRGKIRARSTLEKSLWIPSKNVGQKQREETYPTPNFAFWGGGQFPNRVCEQGSEREFWIINLKRRMHLYHFLKG